MQLDKFHCAACRFRLVAAASGALSCEQCGTSIAVEDGILDFVHGRTDTALDAATYDETHLIDAARSDARYRDIKHLAAEKWPTSLGSVLEVGCGTGLLSRALVSHGEARDLVLTDVSLAMLRTCRATLDRAGLLGRIPLTFATHSAVEPCFRDVVFDTVAGASVLHHIADVRGFLAQIYRWLKPGGRAFFTEPNLRYHRALAQTLADILALLYARDGVYSRDRQLLLNLVAQGRRGILHQEQPAFLATIEDKHLFACDAFALIGRELGFASTEAIPIAAQPTGVGVIGSLCRQVGVDAQTRADVVALLPAFSGRYLSLLSPRDQSASFLLWLEKGTGPRMESFHAVTPAEPSPAALPDLALAGGLPPRWSLQLTASRAADGIELRIDGWCLVNTDVTWVRVTLGDVAREAPVWLPSAHLHRALDPNWVFASWNSLCCGLRETLFYDGATAPAETIDLRIEIVLANGALLPVPAPSSLSLGEMLTVTQ